MKILREMDRTDRVVVSDGGSIISKEPYSILKVAFFLSSGVMPKHGLDVAACEVYRFYKLVTLKGLIEPISMIVPRRVSGIQTLDLI